MELMFEIISRQKFSAGATPTSHVFSVAGGYIGRGDECEWVLPDRARRLSRKHALVSCDGTSFYLEDLSTNGICMHPGKERLSAGARCKIEHGASFTLGEYTIQARLLHNPDTYISPDLSEARELIPDDAFLDLDPLVAMEQQEEFEARRRLGMYDDLLGESQAKAPPQADHSETRLDAMPAITVIPETWVEQEKEPIPAPLPPPVPEAPSEALPETSEFFRILGFDTVPETQSERERVLKQAAHVLLAAVDGMLQSLQNRADSKNELRLPITTMRLAGSNPLKFSPTALAALEYLLAAPQEGMLPGPNAMLTAFDDLHSHHLGLLAGARAAVRACLEKISPQCVEARLDANGPVRFNRTARLWNTYGKMHRSLQEDQGGFAAFFLQDFARAYEVQVRTLHPVPNRYKGEQS